MRNKEIDPKDLMAVERTTTALFSTSISFIVLGFIVEKFELFLHLLSLQLQNKAHKVPQLAHIIFYKYLGIGIILFGVLLSLYTYKYYTNWITLLEKNRIDTDKKIYFFLSISIAIIGVILLASMLLF